MRDYRLAIGRPPGPRETVSALSNADLARALDDFQRGRSYPVAENAPSPEAMLERLRVELVIRRLGL
jgi:hypothetical protein